MPPATELGQLLERYDAFLIDAYGVLVHSEGALPGAAAFLDRIRAADKRFLVVTNDASKLPETGAARYRGFGLPIVAEDILTSGSLIEPHFAEHGLVGRPTVVLGPEDSRRYVERAGGLVVELGEQMEAEALVVCDEAGYDLLFGLDACLSFLFRRLDAGRPVELVLPNPDLIYPKRPGAFGLASGSLALVLESALALRYGDAAPRFARLGKPHAPIYETALSRLGTRAAVMIGDQLHTDILGANRVGLDSVLVGTGVTNPADRPRESELTPTFVLSHL